MNQLDTKEDILPRERLERMASGLLVQNVRCLHLFTIVSRVENFMENSNYRKWLIYPLTELLLVLHSPQ